MVTMTGITELRFDVEDLPDARLGLFARALEAAAPSGVHLRLWIQHPSPSSGSRRQEAVVQIRGGDPRIAADIAGAGLAAAGTGAVLLSGIDADRCGSLNQEVCSER
jgi:hypothetical protein